MPGEASNMRTIFLLVSILWGFPRFCPALDIPLSNALLIHGEPVGFITPPHREKRAANDTVTCGKHDYKPRRSNYCCNKCLAGYRVNKDCSGDGQATQCFPCDSNTYTDIPNSDKKCDRCSSCLPQYGQIVLSECTPEKNTQCGCPEGQYKQKSGSDFICQECATCQNGTQQIRCHDDKDTICRCFHNFFLDHAENRCRPCSECQEHDCEVHCPPPAQSTSPGENNGVLNILLAVVAVVAVTAMGACLGYVYYSKRCSSSSDITTNNPQTTLLIENEESNAKKLLSLPGMVYKQENNPYEVEQYTRQSTEESLPLPDITKGTAPPCLSSPKVVYAIIENIPISHWKQFVRRLGLSNHTIETCEQDYRHYGDAQYAMMQVWITQEGCPTVKRDQLFNVLREINLGGCIEKIEEHL